MEQEVITGIADTGVNQHIILYIYNVPVCVALRAFLFVFHDHYMQDSLISTNKSMRITLSNVSLRYIYTVKSNPLLKSCINGF